MKNKKRLFFDIETSPNIGFFWTAGFKLNIDPDNILQERCIICICYKWEGSKNVEHITWDGQQNDELMLRKFIKILDSADEIVAHNGDRFDITWIRTRCIKYNIPMMPNYISIDTLKASRRLFRFNSNKLDYIGKYLDIGQKMDTGGFALWKSVIWDNNKKSLRKMVDYCKQDVILLEKVWQRFNNYLPAKSHFGETVRDCPECSSHNVVINKRRITASGSQRLLMQCNDCGKYHTISNKKYADINITTNSQKVPAC